MRYAEKVLIRAKQLSGPVIAKETYITRAPHVLYSDIVWTTLSPVVRKGILRLMREQPVTGKVTTVVAFILPTGNAKLACALFTIYGRQTKLTYLVEPGKNTRFRSGIWLSNICLQLIVICGNVHL